MSTQSRASIAPSAADSPAGSVEIAFLELYAEDAAAAAGYFIDGLGFRPVAVAELTDRSSTLLRNGPVQVIVSAPRHAGGPVGQYLSAHGDGVADVALYCMGLPDVLERAADAGVRPVVVGPRQQNPAARMAVLPSPGSWRHTLIDTGPRGARPSVNPPGFAWRQLPGLRPRRPERPLLGVDHLALCLPAGQLHLAADQYEQILGLRLLSAEYVEVGGTGMDSRVLRDAAGALTLVLAEPDPALAPGQVDAFLDAHRGAGVQHVAFACADIVATVTAAVIGGVRTLASPAAYYQQLRHRLAGDPRVLDRIADLQATDVLVAVDHGGLLYQTFTTAPHDRGTLFYEFVQRDGATGFGTDNIKALYQARELADTPRLTA
jgi:4-hydroxymandelate synthase